MIIFKHDRPILLKFFLLLALGLFVHTSTFAQEKLIFAIDIVRHGDRTPVITSPEMEKKVSQGAGQLTSKGMRQEYALGKLLRQYYVNQYHLLPSSYDITTMTVRASAFPRTMMSAQSILYGLYPLGTGPLLSDSTKALPKGLQPIPINTVPREQDSLLVPTRDKALSQQLLKTYILNSPAWIQKDETLNAYYPGWSKIFGIEINNLLDLISISDRLFIERLYYIAPANGLDEKEVDTIINAGEWAWLYIYNYPQLAYIAGIELAQTIKTELNIATTQSRALKYLLYVAHDSTLAAQLKLLGHTIDKMPPYASRLNYSLFDMGASNFEVRITYNQKPLFIKKCGGDACSLSDFIYLIEHLSKGVN